MATLPEPYASWTDITAASEWILYATMAKNTKDFIDNVDNAKTYLTYSWHYLVGIKSPLANYMKTLIDYVEKLKQVNDKDFNEYKISTYVFLTDLAVLNVSLKKIFSH